MTDESEPPDGPGPGPAGQESELRYRLGGDETPSSAVVRAVASLTNTPALELEPLYDVLDPDHLDGICGGGDDETGIETCSLTFAFNGCLVTVSDEEIRVRHQETH